MSQDHAEGRVRETPVRERLALDLEAGAPPGDPG